MTYDLESQMKPYMISHYGIYIIKCQVNLSNYLIFDQDIALKVYGREGLLSQQIRKLLPRSVISKILEYFEISKIEDIDLINTKSPISADIAKNISDVLYNGKIYSKVRGMVYTGSNDGRCIVAYDDKSVYPFAFCQCPQNDEDYFNISKGSLKSLSKLHWEKISNSNVINQAVKSRIANQTKYSNLNQDNRLGLNVWNRSIKNMDRRIISTKVKIDIDNQGKYDFKFLIPLDNQHASNIVLDDDPKLINECINTFIYKMLKNENKLPNMTETKIKINYDKNNPSIFVNIYGEIKENISSKIKNNYDLLKNFKSYIESNIGEISKKLESFLINYGSEYYVQPIFEKIDEEIPVKKDKYNFIRFVIKRTNNGNELSWVSYISLELLNTESLPSSPLGQPSKEIENMITKVIQQIVNYPLSVKIREFNNKYYVCIEANSQQLYPLEDLDEAIKKYKEFRRLIGYYLVLYSSLLTNILHKFPLFVSHLVHKFRHNFNSWLISSFSAIVVSLPLTGLTLDNLIDGTI